MQYPVPPPGSLVWIRSRRWRVESARRDRSVIRLDVTDGERRLTFLAPFDRPSIARRAGRLRRAHVREAAARLAGLVVRASGARDLPAAIAPQIEILPYQLEPALAVADSVRRLLIADEVGLGKTVQAALALAELKRRRPGFRGMVIVPRSLRDQWTQELEGRFGLSVTTGDREGLDGVVRTLPRGQNPWAGAGTWIVSADFLKQPHVIDAIPPVPWDIVIVDEAHDACGDSLRHEATNEMARRARHVLLLTATPHVGDPARFERLEHMGRLNGLPDPLVAFRRTRRLLGLESRRHIRWASVRLTPLESAVLDGVSAFERATLDAVSERQREGALLLLSVFRKRALSTMTALQISLERRLSWVSGRAEEVIDWIQPRLGFDESTARADDDCAGLTLESGLPAGAEQAWLRRLRMLTAAAVRHESKVRHVVELLRRTREPVLVFTEFRDSLTALKAAIERTLASRRRLAVLHGGQSTVERACALEMFQRGDVSVLLATDVASQGLNLQQQARWVISFELPWMPARIEQRIGRVDRIGQTRVVHASLLVAAHPAEQGLLANLARRTLAVKRIIGDDAFAGVAPRSEKAVAHELLTGCSRPTDEGPDNHVPFITSRRWLRHSRAVARHLLIKRSLIPRWRARDGGIGRPCFAVLRRQTGSSSGTVMVVSVPIVDGTGLLVERRLLCIALPELRPAEVDALACSDAFQTWVANHLQKRLARLRRRALSASATRIAIEEAIARHLLDIRWPRELQAGLFERRGERAFTLARNELSAIESRSRIERQREPSSDLGIASVSLELVFSC